MFQIYDYVWSFRYTGEIPRSELVPLINDAIEQVAFIDESAEWFYKMSNSEFRLY